MLSWTHGAAENRHRTPIICLFEVRRDAWLTSRSNGRQFESYQLLYAIQINDPQMILWPVASIGNDRSMN